jgi:hypothetical protein
MPGQLGIGAVAPQCSEPLVSIQCRLIILWLQDCESCSQGTSSVAVLSTVPL